MTQGDMQFAESLLEAIRTDRDGVHAAVRTSPIWWQFFDGEAVRT